MRLRFTACCTIFTWTWISDLVDSFLLTANFFCNSSNLRIFETDSRFQRIFFITDQRGDWVLMVLLSEFVINQTQKMRQTWYSAGDEFPDFVQRYPPELKLHNEETLSTELDWFSQMLVQDPLDETRRKSLSAEAAGRLKKVGKQIFDLNELQVGTMEKEGIPGVSGQFYRAAREFDPALPTAQIFQASRNVWTMTYLQVLLDLPVKLTPAVFGYSMLYPVSDNLLDDPHLDKQQKLEFSCRFSSWLRGEDAPPRSPKEQQVLNLVRMIEGQYPREQYQQVYEALLAIHAGQEKSLLLPSAPVQPFSADVLGVAIEKGGTSVLADGVLVAGELLPWQMEIIFNYGVFAQFMDDQEDVAGDLQQKSLSVFTECARHGPLDQTMNRLFSFSKTILKGLDSFEHDRSRPLKEISLKGIDLLLIDACARTYKYYTGGYLHELEHFFPFRFKYLKEVRKKIEKRNLSIESLVQLLA